MSNRGPDLLLVNAGTNRQVYEKLDKFAAIEPPFISALAAGYVRDRGHRVEILDANARGMSPKETADYVRSVDPKLVGMIVHGHQPSASSQLMRVVGEICNEIKGLTNTPILLSGLHPNSLPERTLREEACDFVVRGEVYDTLAGLLDSGVNASAKVPGLCFLEDGKFVSNPAAPITSHKQPLDSKLANVAWDLLPTLDKYRAHNWHSFEKIKERSPYGSIYTSLGCPFKCSFCCINSEIKAAIADNNPTKMTRLQVLGNDADRMKILDETQPTIRYWSPDWVIRQIDHLVDQGVRNIKFIDEMFVLHENHYGGIADKIIERGYGDKINIWAYARVDTIRSEQSLEKLRKAGFRWLVLGIESLSQNVRDGADKSYSNEDIFRSVKKVTDAGINVMGNYIFGLPDDDLESMKKTLALAKELNTPWYNGYAALAYPGAPLWDWARRKGISLPGDKEVAGGWTAFSHHSYFSYPLPTDRLPNSEVLAFRDRAFHEYFTNPTYLESVRRKFGQDVVDHMKEVTEHKIKRRILGDKNFEEFYAAKGVTA